MLRNRTLLAVSFAVFAAYVGTDMVVPVRLLYAEEQGASLTVIGAMATSFLISNFVFQYPMGWIADRWGRKRIMVAGLIAQAIISLVYLVVLDPLFFVLLRLIEGAANATMLSPARALIADTITPERRGEAYGIFNSFFNAGLLLGPAIGSGLATFGYGYAFIGSSVARILAMAVVIWMVREAIPQQSSREAPTRRVPLRELFSLPLVGAYILAFGDYLYLGFDLTLFPLWMHDHLGAEVWLIGLVYAFWGIPNTILSPWGGRLADRVRRSWLIFIFGGLQVPIYAIYGWLEVAWPVAALTLVHGAIYALIQPAVDAHVAASTVQDIRGRVQGIYSSVGLLGAFVGANGFTLLYEVDYHLPLLVMGIAFGICVLVGGIMVRLSEARGLVQQTHGGDDLLEREEERSSASPVL